MLATLESDSASIRLSTEHKGRKRREPVWIGRYRVAGKDSAKVLGKAWTKRSRPPAGYLTRSARALEIWFSLARILVMSETLSLAAVKARFSELVDRVERQQDRVIVTRNGKPAAVLISRMTSRVSRRRWRSCPIARSPRRSVRARKPPLRARAVSSLTSYERISSVADAQRASERQAVAGRGVAAPARREFDKLPISVAAAVLETLDAIAENPQAAR
jgi:prevent-host-death family protein